MKKLAFITAAAVAFSASSAFAFDDSDRAAVGKVFDTLISGTTEANFDDVFSVMPPALLAKMAEPTGMDADAFKAIAGQQMKAAMEQVKIKEMTADIDGMTTATSDTGRDYAIVSTSTVMEMNGATLKAVAPSLAFEDDGNWYAIQIQGPEHAALLAEVYPDLADVELPAAEITPVE